MANKRNFKKGVEEIGASVCDEMMAAYYNVDKADKEAISSAVGKVLGAIEKARANSNIFFDKGMKAFEDHKAYSVAKKNFFKSLFNKIQREFADDLDAAVKEFNEAIPAEVKAQNKIAVNE